LFAAARSFAAGRTVESMILSRRCGVVLFASVLAGVVALLIVAKETTQAEGRVAYVGLSAFAVLAAFGLSEALGPRRWLRILGFVFWPTCFLAYNAYAMLEFVVPLRHL
jgi:cell division protein FtsW (lipid II flippase)